MMAAVSVMTLLLVILVTVVIVATPVPATEYQDYKNSSLIITESGLITGVPEISTKGKSFYAYYSIPFAKPPVGNLRFKAPVEGVSWKGIRDGTIPPPPCPQLPSALDHSFINGEEDCLFLNVFTSKMNDTPVALPVLVFLHGGGYTGGRAHRHQPYAFLNEEVVLVTLQYRLGILGFLSTEDDVLPGNLGLKDQLLALRWVSRNIKQFGGDPNKVTIFGQSAGASSAHLLSLSPKSEGLFGRVILQSGSALSSWALGSNYKKTAIQVAKHVGCENHENSSYEMIECLRGVNSDELVNTLPKIMNSFGLPILLGPRVDGDLLPDCPEELVKLEQNNKIDLISGYASEDGAELLAVIRATHQDVNFTHNFNEIAPYTLDYTEETSNSMQLTQWVYEYYMGGRKLEPTANFIQMVTDRIFAAPQLTSAILHSSVSTKEKKDLQARTYCYLFSYRGQHSVLDNYNISVEPNWVSHSDEMFYMFPGAPDWKPLTHPADLAMREVFIKLWTNFAATGNPTPDSSLGFTWEAISKEEQKFLVLLPSPIMMENDAVRKVMQAKQV
ncbi:juvenile hormone esterase-like isoform X2 [Portunus trituberculatus]|uniref:juvenile hormone esterase-like isoform X2 n=1 Tax=Portunus trituberculatus TaxID=210409 RepID=UPI001E1D1760|nr:juvenile hormone esterase-like isoform X2 [Portunus trituberculatus]